MSVTVKRISFWRSEVNNKPGVLARVLGPLAESKTDLEVLMGYRYPGNETQAAIELFPVDGKQASAAAKRAGLAPADIPAFIVSGANKPGRVYSLVKRISDGGINLAFVSAQAVGKKFSAVMGFEKESDAKRAEAIITGKEKKDGKAPKADKQNANQKNNNKKKKK
jgi:hypothetical protein